MTIIGNGVSESILGRILSIFESGLFTNKIHKVAKHNQSECVTDKSKFYRKQEQFLNKFLKTSMECGMFSPNWS